MAGSYKESAQQFFLIIGFDLIYRNCPLIGSPKRFENQIGSYEGNNVIPLEVVRDCY
jgi:hypothetical protein